MSKFKAGDKVKCVVEGNSALLIQGRLYTVKRVWTDKDAEVYNWVTPGFLELKGLENRDYSPSHFELVKEPEMTFDINADISRQYSEAGAKVEFIKFLFGGPDDRYCVKFTTSEYLYQYYKDGTYKGNPTASRLVTRPKQQPLQTVWVEYYTTGDQLQVCVHTVTDPSINYDKNMIRCDKVTYDPNTGEHTVVTTTMGNK